MSSGTSISSSDGFDIHVTNWSNSDSDGDKGSRESVDYRSSNGSWVRDDDSRHSTNQNYSKGSSGRHR